MVSALAAGCLALRRRAGFDQKEILRGRNVALSLGRAAHGARAQLRYRRRTRPLHVDERLQRASPHGMGFVRLACGERGHLGERATAAVDAQQYRKNEGADEAPGFRLRLVARGHHVFAGILPLEPVVLPQVPRTGIGVPQEEQGQLVSKMLHRSRQRAGSKRSLLAPRRYAGRAAGARAVVPPHHQVCR